MKKLDKQVKALRAKVLKPLISLAATAQKLKKARESLLSMKGSPVGPKQFIKKILNMVELRKVG